MSLIQIEQFRLEDIRAQAQVPEEIFRSVQPEVVKVIRENLIGRQIVPVNILNDPAPVRRFYTQKDMSRSQMTHDYDAVEALAEDVVDLAPTDIRVPVNARGFSVKWQSNALTQGTAFQIDTASAEAAAYEVAFTEDELVFNGYSFDDVTFEPGLKGLVQGAGTVVAFGGGAWSLDPQNILDSLSEMLEALRKARVRGPYHLIVGEDLMSILEFAQIGGHFIMEHVQEVLMKGTNTGNSMIVASNFIPDNTAIVIPAWNHPWFSLEVMEDAVVEMWRKTPFSRASIKGVAWERAIFLIKQEKAIGKLTGV